MTKLLEIKEHIRNFCNRFEIYIVPVCKAAIAFVLFFLLSQRLGYAEQVSSIIVTIILTLVCALLPANMIVIFGTIIVLINMWSLSLPAFIFTAAVFLILYVLYFRLSPQKGFYAALTPIALMFNVPYIIPISIGLMDDDPGAVFAVGAGSLSYYMVHSISLNAASISVMNEGDNVLTKLTEVINQVISNKEMLWVTGLLVAASLIVWAIRRLKVDYAWLIAIVVGAIAQFIGRYVININLHIVTDFLMLVLGIVAAVAVGFVLQFFFFNLDYERTERVQFEDEEYYYYVKAIPKKIVTGTEKKVKKFSSHSEEDIEPGEARRRLARELEIENELLDFKNVKEPDLSGTKPLDADKK